MVYMFHESLDRMTEQEQLGALLEQFINKISHPRGETLTLMMNASVTTAQVILMYLAQKYPASTHSELAKAMKLSLSSASQMIERLVKTDLLTRKESTDDRRVRTLTVTPKGRAFLKKLQAVRAREYMIGTETLSSTTRERLIQVLSQSLLELPERMVATGKNRTK